MKTADRQISELASVDQVDTGIHDVILKLRGTGFPLPFLVLGRAYGLPTASGFRVDLLGPTLGRVCSLTELE